MPGQGRPVLPPQMVLVDAIATIISSGMASAAMLEPVQVRPSRTAHSVASICFLDMSFSINLFAVTVADATLFNDL